MDNVPTVGTVRYNGYTFDGASRLSVRTEFVTDDADREIIYHKHTITVRAVIQSDGSTNLPMEEIRARLSKQGAELLVVNNGFGRIQHHPTQTAAPRDVRWGPKPKMLSWVPLGGGNAAEIEWQCEICQAACGLDNAIAFTDGSVLALNYSADYTLDPHGDTTRVLTGYLEIAQSRFGNNTYFSADQYRERISPEPPEGFMRVSRNFHISEDKSRLNFTIVDRQIPSENPWPEGVTEISCEYDVRWSQKQGSIYMASLNMDVRGRRGIPKARLWAHFTTLMRQKVMSSDAGGRYAILLSLRAKEDVFGMGCSFSATWRYTSTITNFIEQAGMFRPIGTTWERWKTSLDDVQFNHRGTAGLELKPSQDAIISLCNPQGSVLRDDQKPETKLRQSSDPISQDPPPPDQSWLSYDMQTTVHRDRPVARLSYMQEPDAEPTTPSMRQSAAPDWGAPGGEDDLLHQSGRSKYVVTLSGSALRAGHKIPRPKLEQVGDQVPVEVSGTYSQKIVGNSLGVPIYAAAWEIDYELPNSPGTVHPEDNLKEGVAGISGVAQQPV